MYVPNDFATAEASALAMVDAFPFAIVVSPNLEATHVPLVRRERTLLGHVARGSSFAEVIAARGEALAIFSGPHAFISPRTYVSPRQVPTWNYVAAHVRGKLAPISDRDGAVDVLRALSRAFDPTWDVEPMLAARADGLVHGIVAFSLSIESVVGKEKIGQNRADVDRISAAHALETSPRDDERAIAARMLAVPLRG